ncbi:hypothetical protein N7468_009741 [Penicillium chermesinum]|uniref:Uncharacterized protein n=1 Tax=Penicillium chermesinum TaxID=63820 RepID=A0A9W9NIH6_9EURO|nr:uncharacterized protein N7468_009741 [Penicillium chermesinum]KAJ5220537.1 hypothetical protein N7468_009741 [Penicillium chermesinum]
MRAYSRFVSDLARTRYNHIDQSSGLGPLDAERVLWKPSSRQPRRSSQSTPKTHRTVIRLAQLLKQRSKSPPKPIKCYTKSNYQGPLRIAT